MSKRDKLNPGIYAIVNITNNKKYIGSATRLKERFRNHKTLLRRNKHFNSHLQNAWNKYGEDNFKFEILEIISDIEKIENLIELLIKKEESYIIKMNSNNRLFGYNSRVICNSSLGIKWTKEQKDKLSKSKKGKYSILQKKARIEEGQKRLGTKNPKTSIWWENLNCLEKERIILAKANSLKLKNKQKLEEFGYKVSPETIIKQKTAKIKSGFIKSAQAYNLDGSFYKRYESISDALKDFSESTKSSYKIVECLKSGKLFANKIWKIGEVPMSEFEYNEIRKKANSHISNLLYKMISKENKYIIFNNKKECVKYIGITKPNINFNKAIKNKGFYHGYYWEIIEPITGNSIYENRVKTGNIERIPSEVQEVELCTENR